MDIVKRRCGVALSVRLLFAVVLGLGTSAAQEEHPMACGGQIVHHSHYTLCYSEGHEQAEWVSYRLTAEEVVGGFKRTNDFRVDPEVATGSADLSDYRYSGYDRGHLVPARDMAFSRSSIAYSGPI